MAEFFLILHLLFILYMIIGFPIGLITNNALFRWVHAGCLGGVTLLMILGLPCPLTHFEEMYTGESYEGSFLAVWLNRLVYLQWFDPRKVFFIDMAFAGLVFSSFLWRPLKKGKRN